MKIAAIRLDTTGRHTIPVLPSPAGEDEALWLTAATLRDSFCATGNTLAHEGIELVIELEAAPPPGVQVRIDGRAAATADVFAVNIHATIQATDWHSGRATCRIPLDATELHGLVATRRRSAWSWKAQPTGGAAGSLGASEHLVFVIAGEPTFPWDVKAPLPPDTVQPWPGALALACDLAKNAVSLDDIPARMVSAVTLLQDAAGNGWRYDSAGSFYLDPRHAGPFWFHARTFIKAARGLDQTLPRVLSCFEAAAVMVTFSNLLGCALNPAVIFKSGCADFNLNEVWPLGQAQQIGIPFSRHVVACDTSSKTTGTFRVFDPVLRLDMDAAPAAAPSAWAFPTAMKMGVATSLPGKSFLLPQIMNGSDLSASTVKMLKRAQIAIPDPDSTGIFDECSDRRLDQFFAEVRQFTPSPVNLRGKTLVIPGFTVLPATSVPQREESHQLRGAPPRTRFMYVPEKPDYPVTRGVILMADIWAGEAEWNARILAELLALAERPPRRIEHNAGLVYAAPDGGTIWVLLDGALARLTSVGNTDIDLLELLNYVHAN